MTTVTFSPSDTNPKSITVGNITSTELVRVYVEDTMSISYAWIVGSLFAPHVETDAEEGTSYLYINLTPNLGAQKRFRLQIHDSENDQYYLLTIEVLSQEVIPLWKDVNILQGVTASPIAIGLIQYGGGTDLYQLTSYKKPGASEQDCIVNDIVSRLFSREFPAIPAEGEGWEMKKADLLRPIHWYNMGDAEQNNTFLYKNDWSYDREGYYKSNDPIRNEIGKRQLLMTTILDSGYAKYIRYYNASGASIGAVTLYPTDATGVDACVWVSDLVEQYPTIAKIISGDTEYNVVDDSCYTHALYYLNAYGAWDSLLIKGASKKRDEYERKTMKRAYRNDSPEARGLYNYANGVTTQWTFVTGWLTDEEASRMHHLLGSTSVYMMDLYTGEISPIVLTNSECEFKTYRNEGLKVVSYEITATYAQDKMRR